MNITLRKAAALQNAIQEALRGIEVQLTVKINEFESSEKVLDLARNVALTNDQRRDDLLKAFYDIRAQVGEANVRVGINQRLARAAYVDKRVAGLAAFLQSDAVQDSMVVIQGKIDKIKNENIDSRSRIYGYSDTVTTGVLSQEQVAGVRKQQQELKKEKQRLNDEILELNVRSEITLSDSTRTVLETEGLL